MKAEDLQQVLGDLPIPAAGALPSPVTTPLTEAVGDTAAAWGHREGTVQDA